VFIAAALALKQFPWTRGAANDLFSWVVAPLSAIGHGAAASMPNLIFLAILVVIVRWALKIARLFFEAVKRGAVHLQGFDADWAIPTYQLLRLFLILFAMIAAYPYIPGSGSEAFKAISIFAG